MISNRSGTSNILVILRLRLHSRRTAFNASRVKAPILTPVVSRVAAWKATLHGLQPFHLISRPHDSPIPWDSPPGNCARIEVNGGEKEDRNLRDPSPLWNYKGRVEILPRSISLLPFARAQLDWPRFLLPCLTDNPDIGKIRRNFLSRQN